jgi:Ca2+-binding RTX toxin-like protein
MPIMYGTALANILKGTSGDDVLYGLGGNDVLYGYAGNDSLIGGPGADRMYGGTGNDTYLVDSPYDEVIEAAGQGIDTVRTSTSYALPSNVENLVTTNGLGTASIDLLGNDLANRIYGNNGNNAIFGAGGADILIGGGGDDSLRGGTGSDRLTGGAGSDSFIFDDAGSRDMVTDFQHGIDKIDLGWFWTEMGQHFDFIGAAAFDHHSGQGRFANGILQVDFNGDAVADFSAAIAGEITASDFVFGAGGFWDY